MIATQVSSPIRSASASGPMGCAKPSFAIVSIASGSATPSISAYAASFTKGMRMRFETKPGKSRASRRDLAEVLGERDDRGRGLVRGLEAADHLDELQHGHRVEEVHPDHLLRTLRGGREPGDRDRGRVRGEHGARREELVGGAEDLLLHRDVLDRGLDQEVGGREVVHGLDPREHLAGIDAALLGELLEALADRLERALGRSRNGIVERHPPAGGGDDLRDAAAHLPRADDVHVLEAHRAASLRLRRARQARPRAARPAPQRPREDEPEDEDPDHDLDRTPARLAAGGDELSGRDEAARAREPAVGHAREQQPGRRLELDRRRRNRSRSEPAPRRSRPDLP